MLRRERRPCETRPLPRIAACFLLLVLPSSLVTETTALTVQQQPSTYQYFAIGSNVDPATMLCLRNLHPLQASAAVLPGYRLAFLSMSPGGQNPWRGETSSAACAQFVNPDEASYDDQCLHGVVYELTTADFIRLSISEGVPWVYRWESCTVYPYQGEPAGSAGQEALRSPATRPSLEAQVLVAAPSSFQSNDNDAAFSAPSASYLNIIQQGAALWNLDQSFQDQLARIPTATNRFLFPEGTEGRLLDTARRWNPRSKDMERLLRGINLKET